MTTFAEFSTESLVTAVGAALTAYFNELGSSSQALIKSIKLDSRAHGSLHSATTELN